MYLCNKKKMNTKKPICDYFTGPKKRKIGKALSWRKTQSSFIIDCCELSYSTEREIMWLITARDIIFNPLDISSRTQTHCDRPKKNHKTRWWGFNFMALGHMCVDWYVSVTCSTCWLLIIISRNYCYWRMYFWQLILYPLAVNIWLFVAFHCQRMCVLLSFSFVLESFTLWPRVLY